MSDNGDEWYTPPYILDLVRDVLGDIEFDPYSCDAAQINVRAERYYTIDNPAAPEDWRARNCFFQPPYSRGNIDSAVEAFCNAWDADKVGEAIALVNNKTETKWFHELLYRANVMCIIKGRLKFWKADGARGSGRSGQVVFNFGGSPDRFYNVFGRLGKVMFL